MTDCAGPFRRGYMTIQFKKDSGIDRSGYKQRKSKDEDDFFHDDPPMQRFSEAKLEGLHNVCKSEQLHPQPWVHNLSGI